MPVSFSLVVPARYDPDLKHLVFDGIRSDEMPPVNDTLLLTLMVNGSYSGADFGPLAGQYDGLWPFLGTSLIPITLATTEIPVGGLLETWPSPSPPFEITIRGTETVTVTAINRKTSRITVTRSAPLTHPSNVVLRGDRTLVDAGQTPPLLYVPGEPTLAPARTGSWWAHVVSGSPDTTFSLWESRYWQSAPNLPVGHPVWATLCMLARKVDGTEESLGLFDPLTHELHVALLGAVPDAILFQPRGILLGFTQTEELLPLPEVFGDIAPPADSVATVPPDPRQPPFTWHYPLSSWTPQLVGSLPNNNEDLWLPILLSSRRSTVPINNVSGWDDVTGGVDDTPIFKYDQNWFSNGNYAVRRQVANATFTATHDPNPITYDLLKVGGTPSTANVPSTGLGAARVPCVGQQPWWELDWKQGEFVLSTDPSVTPTTPIGTGSSAVVTGDIMLIVAQSDGVAAPSIEGDWTLIDAVSGPNAYGHQPVTIATFLWAGVAAGASTIQVSLASLTDLGPAPFTVVIEGGSPLGAPSETLTASSCAVNVEGGFATLGIGSVGSAHFGGSDVVITNPGLLAYDQYVAAWWKVAEGPPPDGFGVPQLAEETGPAITFSDATRCSARMYACTAEQTDPFSPPGVARLDIAAPAGGFGGLDVIPEDGITLRVGIGLAVGTRQVGFAGTPTAQDIREDPDGPVFMMLPVANPFPPSYEWTFVDPASVGTALTFAFRGFRERPEYPMVDGHYAPNYDNRGALPPCAGGGLRGGGNMRNGYGISLIDAPANPAGRVLFSRGSMSGNARYLRAWVWAESASFEVEATITVDGGEEISWFETLASDIDFYADPPDDRLFFDERPFSIRIITRDALEGYIGVLAWSEEECQPPSVASYGLTAAFRYRHQDLHMPSTQQASIVG